MNHWNGTKNGKQIIAIQFESIEFNYIKYSAIQLEHNILSNV